MDCFSPELVQIIGQEEISQLQFPCLHDDYKIYVLPHANLDVELLKSFLMTKTLNTIRTTHEFYQMRILHPWETSFTDAFLTCILKVMNCNPSHISQMIVREYSEHHYNDVTYPNLVSPIQSYIPQESEKYNCFTIYTFLSDFLDGNGGHIYFPKLGLRIRAEKGKSILIFNTTNDGDTIMESMCGVSVVTSGEIKIMETSIRILLN